MTNQPTNTTIAQLKAMGFSDELVETPRRIIISLGGKEKTAKCLTGDSTVVLMSGEIVFVSDVIPGMEIASIDPSGNAIGARVKSVASDGVREVLRILLSDGRQIRVTPEHKFYTRIGWLEAKNLCVSDRVLVPCHLVVNSSWMGDVTHDEASIIGYLLADGGLTCSPRFTKDDVVVMSDFKDTATRCGFNLADYTYNKKAKTVGLSGDKFRTFRSRFSLFGEAKSKLLPQEVFKWEKSLQAALLRSYFTCDGWITRATSGGIVIGACSASKEMMCQIAGLLLRWGITTHLRCKPVNGVNYWSLEGSTASALLYVNHIGFYGGKQEKANRLIAQLGVTPKRQGYLANSDIHGRNEPVIHDSGMWGRVKEVSILDEKQAVYDIEIDGDTQCFVANNILVHNTHFACTAPDPIFYFNMDNGAEGVVNKFQNIGKKIYVKTVRVPKGESQDKYKEIWLGDKDGVKPAILKACEFGRGTIIMDTATEIYELSRLSHFGKLEQVKPFHYNQVNSEWQKEILQALYDSNMNAVLIHKIKPVWIDEKRTKDYEIAGFSDTGYKVQIKATTFREMVTTADAEGNETTIPQFGLRIDDCRNPASLIGQEIRNLIPVHDGELVIDPRLSFDALLDMVHGAK